MSIETITSAATATPTVARDVPKFQARSIGKKYVRQLVLTSLPLVVADALAVILAVAFAAGLLLLVNAKPINHYPTVVGLMMLSTFVVNLCFGLYPAAGLHPIRELQRVAISSTLVCGILFVGAVARLNPASPYVPLFVIVWVSLTSILLPLRCLVRRFCREQDWWGFQAILIGCGSNPKQLVATLNREKRRGVRLVGFFSEGDEYWGDDFENPDGCEYLGSYAQISQYTTDNDIFWAFAPQSGLGSRPLRSFTEEYRLSFPNYVIINDQYVLPGLWNETVEFQDGVSGLRLREDLMLTYPRLMKRGFDAIASALGVLLLSPLFLLVALGVRLTSKGPVFYGHKRIGIGGQHFKAWKFRTMVLNADSVLEQYFVDHPELRTEWEKTQKLKHDPRVTSIGNFLRATSLDELPQLWNVLKGEMSLVGPRPIVDNEVKKYADVYGAYLRVKPGITGLWQISGRNDTTYEERVSFDDYYVSNWSLWMDIYILGRTLKTVLFREGAY